MGFVEFIKNIKMTVKIRGFKPFFVYIPVIAAVLIAIYFLAPFLLSLFSGISLIGKVSCVTEDCFVNAANECLGAVFRQEFDGSVFVYSTENCILTKKLGKIDESEPQEIKDLLEGKSMECAYEKGAFDSSLISTLSIGIENCEGDLKDAIDELMHYL